MLGNKDEIVFLDLNGIIACFKSTGEFSHQIGCKGRGPGEYLSVTDICLNEEGDELLLLQMGKVLRYALQNGRFLGETATPQQNYDAIAPSGNQGFFLFAANPGDLSDFTTPFYALTEFDNGGDVYANFSNFIRSDFYKLPIYIHDTPELLYFSSIGPQGKANDFLYSKETGQGIHWEDNATDPFPIRMMASDKNYLYALFFPSEETIQPASKNPLAAYINEHYPKKQTQSQNPIAVKLKCKL